MLREVVKRWYKFKRGWFVDLFNAWKDYSFAKKTGQLRCAPYGVRGRIYKTPTSAGNVVSMKGTTKVTVRPAKVFRAAEGKWYDLVEDENGNFNEHR